MHGFAVALVLAACAGEAAPATAPAAAPRGDRPAPAAVPPAPPPPETSLGVTDVGIWSDLDAAVQIELPDDLPGRVHAVLDASRAVLVLYADDWPVKVYPLTGPRRLVAGGHELALRPGDHAELAPLLRGANAEVARLADGAQPAPGDLDDDGIPDPLDIVLGARKTALNGASYGAGYIRLQYPGGDVPRDKGVCTDVVVRAVRNAGLDLQHALSQDIRRAPRSYPMVERPNPHIDHRRVKTSLPYFQRHWDPRSAAVDDPDDPVRPGDVVFFDTFPKRRGPDHVGVVSDRRSSDGTPLVINNWTYGATTTDLELLSWLPVTHRFRFPSQSVDRD